MIFKNLIQRLSAPNIKPFKKWSTRDKYSKKLIKEIRAMLAFISGDDFLTMMKSLLTNKEIESLNSKYSDCLKKLSGYYKTLKPKKRHHFIRPLKESNFSRKEAMKLGFRSSNNLWSSCFNTSERISKGRAKTDKNLIKSIQEHMENLSSIAANRTIKLPIKDIEG